MLRRMRCVVFSGAGGPEVVSVAERPDPVAGTGEVLVRVRYAGLNPADLIQRAGNYPAPPGFPPDVPGLEVAGEVIARGSGAERFAVGERVFGLVGGGGLADRVVVHERCVAPVPDGMSETDAAAVPEAFITAHDAIRTRGRLSPGEMLLVQGANGGVGTAALQIATAGGSRALGVVRSAEAADLVRSLAAEPVLAEQVADVGRGSVDVILELIGAPNLPIDLQLIAQRGRIVVVGTGQGADAAVDLRYLMGKRAELHGTVLRARSLEDKAQALRAFEREVVPQLAAGRARALVDSIYPHERVNEAFDRLAGPGKAGKVLIEFAPDC